MKLLMILMIALTYSSGLLAQKEMDKSMKMDSTQIDHEKDHLIMQDGKMLMIMGGKKMVMDKNMTLKDGTIVMPDGTVKSRDGRSMRMKNGDMIYMDGKMGKMESDKPKTPNNDHHH